MIIHSYNRGSGIKNLKKALEERGEKVLILNREPKGRRPFVVCWGSVDIPGKNPKSLVLNPPKETEVLRNKLKFFRRVSEIEGQEDFLIQGLEDSLVPLWTTQAEETRNWLLTVARTKLTSSGGDGILLIEQGQKIPHAPLYVRYQKKTSEFRLHVFKTLEGFETRFVQKKVAKKGFEDPNFKIRSHDNGFVFQHRDIVVPEAVSRISTEFMTKYFPKIDFVALDVIYSKKEDRAWVLEGNTAPGLEGKTVQVYADYLLERKRTR